MRRRRSLLPPMPQQKNRGFAGAQLQPQARREAVKLFLGFERRNHRPGSLALGDLFRGPEQILFAGGRDGDRACRIEAEGGEAMAVKASELLQAGFEPEDEQGFVGATALRAT